MPYIVKVNILHHGSTRRAKALSVAGGRIPLHTTITLANLAVPYADRLISHDRTALKQ